jgi:hypothetical protein
MTVLRAETEREHRRDLTGLVEREQRNWLVERRHARLYGKRENLMFNIIIQHTKTTTSSKTTHINNNNYIPFQ